MDDRTSWSSAGARRPDPSWPKVIATTVRLWLERHRGSVSVRLAVVILLAGALTGGTLLAWGPEFAPSPAHNPHNPHKTSQPKSAASPGALAVVRAAAAARDQAAAWITTQAATNAIVGCDPAMCAALQESGFPAGRLLLLGTTATDPLGSDLVIATPSLRNQFGARLAGVYAPAMIASFGSGASRIDIRAIAPDGSAAYRRALGADQRARIAAGRQLLRNRRISVSAAARAALLGGAADPRLLVVLAALAAQQPVRIIAFGDPAPGNSPGNTHGNSPGSSGISPDASRDASPGVPLRGVQIAPGRGGTSGLRSMLRFLDTQRPPFLPVRSSMTGTSALTVEYGAPSPLGLLG